MTTINYANEFKTTFVINSDTIPYMKNRGIQIVDTKPYIDHDFNASYSEVTIVVKPTTLIEMLYAGVHLALDKKVY
ncbi:hypothetical protein UFOVP462_33 [uncultured Caudovirales phage]|uniref:Uncharacterized protein n=1 Tax=uncultured Caudovirales phage TaxID=2100421 RepID=A0A6J5MCM6_9CAUD|nr:hypothetical protein UFOVP462_33 [uncultured Caudovirales phage]